MQTLVVFAALVALAVLQPRSAVFAESIYSEATMTDGIIVHLGCEEPSRIVALHPGPKRLVLAFGLDAAAVQQCRERLTEEGKSGPASATLLTGHRLPLPDDFVNLIIAPRPLGISPTELQRVLVPGGAVHLEQQGSWQVIRKANANDIDDWTHFLYDSTNNAVSRDRRAGPADSLQWVDGPLWTRSHDFLSTFAVAVSDGGRLFSILDEAPVASAMIPPRWTLVCRDAFNGTVLWKRDLSDWFDEMYPMRSGPNHLLRRLVATDDRVFVTLGANSQVSVLDAATGETIRELAGTGRTEEILYRNGCLYLVLNPESASEQYYKSRLDRVPLPAVPVIQKTIVAFDVPGGNLLWRKSDHNTSPVMELTLAVDDERVYYATDDSLICLDRKTGVSIWKAEISVELQRPTWSVPTLAVYKDVVFFGDRVDQPTWETADQPTRRLITEGNMTGEVKAFAAADGHRLWSCKTNDGYHFPIEVFVANGRVWTGAAAYPTGSGFIQARDYRTGEIVFEREPDSSFAVGHHRCHRNKATDRFLVTGRGFVEWVDLATGRRSPNIFLRGTCSFGVIPANGLVYVPPDPCICRTEAKMRGLCVLSSKQATGSGIPVSEPKLTRGPAYTDQPDGAVRPSANDLEDWPTYRHDGERNGVTTMKLSTPLKISWRQQLSDHRLTSPTASDGKILTASPETHSLHCLDAQTGERRWDYIAGSRIDTPPTIHQGRVFFGGRDGCLYALDLESGGVVWQLELVPNATRINAFGQFESTQPLHGSVLIDGESLYVLSGRSSFLDGGLHLFKIRAVDGQVITTRSLAGELVDGKAVNALLPDLLTGTVDGFYVGNRKFAYEDLSDIRKIGNHLWSPTGLLDDSWLHRTYWIYGTQWGRTWPLLVSRLSVPAGRLLCVDADSGIVYGFGRNKYGWGISPQHWQSGEKYYQVHATPIEPLRDDDDKPNVRRGTSLSRTPLWSVKSDIAARALAVTDGHVLIAGPQGKTIFSEAAFRGEEGVALLVIDKRTGAVVQEIALDASPTFDGVMAAHGNVYVSLENGSIACFAAQADG